MHPDVRTAGILFRDLNDHPLSNAVHRLIVRDLKKKKKKIFLSRFSMSLARTQSSVRLTGIVDQERIAGRSGSVIKGERSNERGERRSFRKQKQSL